MDKRSNESVSKPLRYSLTLKQSLTIITIVAILLGLTLAVRPGHPDPSEPRTIANMDQVAKVFLEYAARKDNVTGFPPAYGYLRTEAAEKPSNSLTDADFVLEPYTYTVGIHGIEDVYQLHRYAQSFDMNGDGQLSLMEYLPLGELDNAEGTYEFSTSMYTGTNRPQSGTLDEVESQLSSTYSRPFVYIPINKAQLQAARDYWSEQNDALGASYDSTDSRLASLTFPPAVYDGFVLIGNSPSGTDGGLCAVDPPGTPGDDYDSRYVYHILGLRVAFLATRDWPVDGKADKLYDFSFMDRKMAVQLHRLPDGSMGHGAFIKVVMF